MSFQYKLNKALADFKGSLEETFNFPQGWKISVDNVSELDNIKILDMIYSTESNDLNVELRVYKCASIEHILEKTREDSDFREKVSNYFLKKSKKYAENLVNKINDDPLISNELFLKEEANKSELMENLSYFFDECAHSEMIDIIKNDLDLAGIKYKCDPDKKFIEIDSQNPKECESIDSKLENAGLSFLFNNDTEICNPDEDLYKFCFS